MAKRRRIERAEPSRKEQAMTRRERERARQLTVGVGVVIALALVLLLGGVLYQWLFIPNSAVASVNGDSIATKDLWNLTRFDQYQRTKQLENLWQYQNQIDPGGQQGFFTSQIQQLQSDLINPEGSTNRVLEQMVEEKLVRQLAEKNGVNAADDEVQAQLASLIASQQGAVTEPDATATAQALANATPTPSPTPSPTPTTTVASTVTVTPVTPEPTPTVHIQTADELKSGLDQLFSTVAQGTNLSADQVRRIYTSLITSEILKKKLTEKLGSEMPTSGEQVHARHILISVASDATEADQQVALAKAISITQRLKDGADFATLAEKYSNDTGSAAKGGDLGFFPRGQMVAEFENAAFSLPVGQISDPVKSQFGYHIIEVLETKPGSPDFTAWLQNKKAESKIVRSLTSSRLPKLPAVPAQLLQNPTTTSTDTAAPLVITPVATTPEATTPAAP